MRIRTITVILLGVCVLTTPAAYGGDMCEWGNKTWHKVYADYQIEQAECASGGDSLFSNLESVYAIRKYRITIPNQEINSIYCEKDGEYEVDFNAATGAAATVAMSDSIEIQVDVWSPHNNNEIGLDGTYWLCEGGGAQESIPDHLVGAEDAEDTANYVISNIDTLAPAQPMTIHDLRFLSQPGEMDLRLLDFSTEPVLVNSYTIQPGETWFYPVSKDSNDTFVYFECWVEHLSSPGTFARLRVGAGPTTVSEVFLPPGAEAVRLHQNVPNPFNPMTTIHFDLFEAEPVEMVIYDIAGRRVATLLNRWMDVGPHSVVWRGRTDNGAQAPAGIYQYTLRGRDWTESRRMVLVK
jgi:hypothetical protein